MNKKANLFFHYDRFMRLPKYPSNRGGGTFQSKFKYKHGDCKCIYCTNWEKKKGCTVQICPYLEERVESEDIRFSELFNGLLNEHNDKTLNKRVREYIKETLEMGTQFHSKAHQKRFERTLKAINKKNKSLVAVIYLLTADLKVWNQCWSRLQHDNIQIERIRLKEASAFGYTLFCAAKDIYLGSTYITVKDMADRGIIMPKEFNLICNAIGIKRYGLKAVYMLSDDTEQIA